jgi:hypothetical protein
MIKLIDLPLFGFIIGIPVVIGLLIYFVPRLLGYPKTAKILTIIYSVIVLCLILFIVLGDQFFTKKDAIKLIEEQGFSLKDEFELVDNKSSWAIGDYFHSFSIKISNQDKSRAIEYIKNSEGFKKLNEPIDDFLFSKDFDKHQGSKQIQNYENEYSYVREYLQPNGGNYAPTFRRIMISKKGNLLTFQDIIE